MELEKVTKDHIINMVQLLIEDNQIVDYRFFKKNESTPTYLWHVSNTKGIEQLLQFKHLTDEFYYINKEKFLYESNTPWGTYYVDIYEI